MKARIKPIIKKNKKFWKPLNDGRGLERMIEETKTFEELILMFR
jgi:hypothetical protein